MVGCRTSPWKALLAGLCLTVIGLGASPSRANLPFAGQHYPNGAEDFLSGALPPPGFYIKDYLASVQKFRLTDDDGKKVPVDLKVNLTVAVPRFIWMTPVKILGGNLGGYAVFPLYWSDVRSNALGIDSRDSGLGDIPWAPLIAWHFGPSFHVAFAEEVVVPTGNYRGGDPASQILSKNHWTFETILAATYIWRGLDLSVKAMYDVNTKNDDYTLGVPGVGAFEGELKPGQEFHFDWALSYARTETLRYGISGYAYWQVTKDEFTSDAIGTVKGDKGQIFAAGPTIKYWPNQGRFSATLKHQREFGAKNLPEGQLTWLNLIWAF
ncbi:MAG: transporter [Deltaproteobacteria bacterium]|nr:transporter [Deltaproteobacteria bacterium]